MSKPEFDYPFAVPYSSILHPGNSSATIKNIHDRIYSGSRKNSDHGAKCTVHMARPTITKESINRVTFTALMIFGEFDTK